MGSRRTLRIIDRYRSRANALYTCNGQLTPLSPALSPAGRGRLQLTPLSPALSPAWRGRLQLTPLSPALSPAGRGRLQLMPLSPAGEGGYSPGSGRTSIFLRAASRRSVQILR